MLRNLLKTFLVMLILSCQLWMMTSCDQQNNPFTNKKSRINIYNSLIGQAKQYLKTYPDSAIFFADSAQTIAGQMNLESGHLYLLNKIKADAFESQELFDSAYRCIEKAWLSANFYSDTLSRARAAELLGAYNLQRNNYFMAEKYLVEASNLYTLLNMDYEKAKTETNYSVVLTYKGESSKSQQHLLSACSIFYKLDSLNDLSAVCINIGNNYADLENYGQARKFYLEAYKASEVSYNFTNQTRAMLNMGTLYRVSNPDSALYYFHLTDSLLKKNANPWINLKLQYNLANVYSEKGDFNKALTIYGEVLDYCKQKDVSSGISRALNGVSTVYEMKGDLDKTILFKNRAMRLADSTGETGLMVTFMEELARVYKKQGDLNKAISLYQKAKVIGDSIRKVDNSGTSKELELLAEVQQKENESELLKMELNNKQNSLRLRLFLIFALIGFIILLGLLLHRSIRLNRERLRAYSVLMEKFIAEKALKNQVDFSKADNTVITEDPHMADTLFLNAVISYYQDEKPYLDPKLRIETVAEKLNTSQKAIAQALKMYNNSNFNKFTNFFRVEEAKQILADDKYKNYKIEAIAVEAGFGTTRSFYNSFEQFTGIKPSFFRNYLQEKQDGNFSA